MLIFDLYKRLTCKQEKHTENKTKHKIMKTNMTQFYQRALNTLQQTWCAATAGYIDPDGYIDVVGYIDAGGYINAGCYIDVGCTSMLGGTSMLVSAKK